MCKNQTGIVCKEDKEKIRQLNRIVRYQNRIIETNEIIEQQDEIIEKQHNLIERQNATIGLCGNIIKSLTSFISGKGDTIAVTEDMLVYLNELDALQQGLGEI